MRSRTLPALLLPGLLVIAGGCGQQPSQSASRSSTQPEAKSETRTETKTKKSRPKTPVKGFIKRQAIDRDGDGKIDAWRERGPRGELFEHQDNDGDGKPEIVMRIENSPLQPGTATVGPQPLAPIPAKAAEALEQARKLKKTNPQRARSMLENLAVEHSGTPFGDLVNAELEGLEKNTPGKEE